MLGDHSILSAQYEIECDQINFCRSRISQINIELIEVSQTFMSKEVTELFNRFIRFFC